jgi:hypothetical protein
VAEPSTGTQPGPPSAQLVHRADAADSGSHGRPDPFVGTQWQHLALLLAGEQVVVILQRDESCPAVFALEMERLAQFPGVD